MLNVFGSQLLGFYLTDIYILQHLKQTFLLVMNDYVGIFGALLSLVFSRLRLLNFVFFLTEPRMRSIFLLLKCRKPTHLTPNSRTHLPSLLALSLANPTNLTFLLLRLIIDLNKPINMVKNFLIVINPNILQRQFNLVDKILFLFVHLFDYDVTLFENICLVCVCPHEKEMQFGLEIVALEDFYLFVGFLLPFIVFLHCGCVNFHQIF